VDKTPFSVYDFFAYLASGAMIVVSVDYLFGEQLVLRPTLSPQMYLLLVIASYVVGQVISHLSAVVLEQWLVKRCLGARRGCCWLRSMGVRGGRGCSRSTFMV
jgi:hypothetical protein